MIILMIEMPELFATCSDTDTADGTLVTATVPGVDGFGWTTLLVLEQKRTYVHNCRHREDVSVSCITVRLVGGPSPREGRLQVRYNGAWGTVCDNGFNDNSAGAVCNMLGHGKAGHVLGNRYGAGSGPIWLDQVICIGWETNIAICRHRGWGRHNCTHNQDVSVSCPSVKLVGRSSRQEGRLEVYHNGIWGNVCDNGFTNAAARVICHMLGYGHVGWFIGNRYGDGSGPT